MIITLVIVTLSLIITVVLIQSNRTAQPTHPLVGKWMCYTHNPYIDCFKWQRNIEKDSPTPFSVTLFENGSGVFNNERTRRPVYFSCICEDEYVIIDLDIWYDTKPIYLKIVDSKRDSWCEVKICKNMPEK